MIVQYGLNILTRSKALGIKRPYLLPFNIHWWVPEDGICIPQHLSHKLAILHESFFFPYLMNSGVFMRYYLIILLLFCGHSIAIAQLDTSLIRQQFEKARQLNEEKSFKQAAVLANSALRSLREIPSYSVALEVQLIHILGDCALEKSDYAEAIAHYETAQSRMDSPDWADHPLKVENLNKIGNYFREVKDFDQALGILNQGLSLGQSIFNSNNLKMANLYNNIGICYSNMGDFDKALEFYNQALNIRQALLPDTHPQIAQSYNNLGLCWLDKRRYDEALRSFELARNTYVRHYRDNHQDIADVHLNMGNVYFELQDQRLFTEYSKALEIYSQTLRGSHPSVALCYNNLANAYAGQDDFEQASGLYQKAQDIMIYNYGEVHPDVAMSLYNTGISYYFAGQDQLAKQLFERCLKALNFQAEAEPLFDQVNDRQILLRLFKSMADLDIEAYYISQELKSLENAFKYYRLLDQLMDYLRISYQAEGSKLSLMETAHEIYDAGIELALALYQLSDSEKYLHEAFQFSEKSKGILLLEALQKTEAESFAGIPSERISELSQLKQTISELEKKRFLEWEKTEDQDKKLIDSLNTLIFEQKQALTRKIKALERKYPQYYELRYETTTIPIEVVQKELLKPQQTIISYFMGANSLQIFVINKNDFRVISLNLDAAFFEQLNIFNHSIINYSTASSAEVNNSLNNYVNSAHQLYQYLIAPVAEMLEEQLLIIPDGELGYVSFGALLSQLPEKASALNTHPYLIRDYSISYSYSVRLLKEMNTPQKKKRLQPYLGVAPHFLKDNEKGLQQLRYNDEEVHGVREMIGGATLFKEEATKENFMRQASDFKVIHLATHGKANSAAGDYSFLAFSETPNLRGDRALLFVKEIYNTSINAEMVVLSACETSTGQLHKGEGIASIARSFSYAGAKSLLATQWSVDDKATHDLIQAYFEKIKSGLPKDKAMKEAMVTFLSTNGKAKAHPYYWASFVLIGNVERLDFGSRIPLMIWGLPVLLVGALLIYRKRRNLKNQL